MHLLINFYYESARNYFLFLCDAHFPAVKVINKGANHNVAFYSFENNDLAMCQTQP